LNAAVGEPLAIKAKACAMPGMTFGVNSLFPKLESALENIHA
jgi:hypothetical protein